MSDNNQRTRTTDATSRWNPGDPTSTNRTWINVWLNNEQKLEPQDNLPSFTTDGSSSLTRALLKHRELAEIITGVECFYNSLDRTMRYEMKLCCKHQKQSSTKLTVSLMYASKQPRSTMNICVPTSPMWITVSPGAHWSGWSFNKTLHTKRSCFSKLSRINGTFFARLEWMWRRISFRRDSDMCLFVEHKQQSTRGKKHRWNSTYIKIPCSFHNMAAWCLYKKNSLIFIRSGLHTWRYLAPNIQCQFKVQSSPTAQHNMQLHTPAIRSNYPSLPWTCERSNWDVPPMWLCLSHHKRKWNTPWSNKPEKNYVLMNLRNAFNKP